MRIAFIHGPVASGKTTLARQLVGQQAPLHVYRALGCRGQVEMYFETAFDSDIPRVTGEAMLDAALRKGVSVALVGREPDLVPFRAVAATAPRGTLIIDIDTSASLPRDDRIEDLRRREAEKLRETERKPTRCARCGSTDPTGHERCLRPGQAAETVTVPARLVAPELKRFADVVEPLVQAVRDLGAVSTVQTLTYYLGRGDIVGLRRAAAATRPPASYVNARALGEVIERIVQQCDLFETEKVVIRRGTEPDLIHGYGAGKPEEVQQINIQVENGQLRVVVPEMISNVRLVIGETAAFRMWRRGDSIDVEVRR